MASARCTSTPSRVSGPAALLAPPASRYLAGKAAGLPRLLPICAQRTPSRQSPARRARRRLGRMTQPSTPEANKSLNLYHQPANLFVAGFLGSPQMNFWTSEVRHVHGRAVTVAGPTGNEMTAE